MQITVNGRDVIAALLGAALLWLAIAIKPGLLFILFGWLPWAL